MAHWSRLLSSDSVLLRKIILFGGGHRPYLQLGAGRGTRSHLLAGSRLLGPGAGDPGAGGLSGRRTTRPLYARAAKDNTGSLRVLEKCGFTITGEDRGYANARGEEVDEYLLALR
jgi:hypothetical protein